MIDLPGPTLDAVRRCWQAIPAPGSSVTGGDLYLEYRHNPVGFFRDILGVEPWEKQEQMAQALHDDQRLTAATCNGAGKSTWAAWIVAWFMSTRRDARCISTAGVFPQVKDLWRKIRSLQATAKRPLPGRCLQMEWELSPSHFAYGRSSDSEEGLQGLHSLGSNPQPGDDGGALALVDEASACEDHVFRAMSGYMTSDNCYWALLGNPNRGEGGFFDSHQRGRWTRFQISAFDVPENIISRQWIDDMRAQYGEDSIQWQVRVLGQFPKEGGVNQVFPRWILEGAKDAHPIEDTGMHIGVDVAREGDDRNVAVLTKDNRVVAIEKWTGMDLQESARNIAALAGSWGIRQEEAYRIHIDYGMGAGVYDRLAEAGWWCDLVNFGEGPRGEYRDVVGDMAFLNRKAELHWAGRELLRRGLASIPEEWETLWKQLAWLNYKFADRSDKLQVEAKAKLKSKWGESPDYADAWILSLSREGMASRVFRL